MRVGASIIACALIGAIIAHLTVLHDFFGGLFPAAILVGVIVIGLREQDAAVHPSLVPHND